MTTLVKNAQTYAAETRLNLATAKETARLMMSPHACAESVRCSVLWIEKINEAVEYYFAQITEIVDGLDGATNEEREAALRAFVSISQARRTVRGFVAKIPACKARHSI